MSNNNTTQFNFMQPRNDYTIVNTEYNQLMEAQLNADEKQKLQQFINRLQKDFPKDVASTETLIRFLRARKWNLDNAEKMYRDRMKWVQEYQPHKITLQDVNKELKTGKIVWYGRDKHQRPILILRTRYHIPSDTTAEDSMKFMIFMAELGMQMLPKPPYNQFIMISDRFGTSRKNFDPNTFKRIGAVANYYPETLGNILVLGANWIFWLVHKFVSTFLDPVTMGKMILLSGDHKKAMEEMQERIDEDQLLPEYNGVVKNMLQIPPNVPHNVLFSEELIKRLHAQEQEEIQQEQNKVAVEHLDLD